MASKARPAAGALDGLGLGLLLWRVQLQMFVNQTVRSRKAGKIVGTIAGAAVIGSSTGFVEKLVSQPPMAKVLVLATVVCILLIRPAGLFAVKERTYE